MKSFAIFILSSLFALFLGLFILPEKVELIRFIDIEARPEKVWSAIATVEGWDAWDPYNQKAVGDMRPWTEGELRIVSVDADKQEIKYSISAHDAEGDLSLALKPANEGVILRWHHSYVGGYWPWERVSNWFDRSKMALKFDEGLVRLKSSLEEQ